MEAYNADNFEWRCVHAACTFKELTLVFFVVALNSFLECL